MTPTTDAPERVRDFVHEVGRYFDDLPDNERVELLEDLEHHLLELEAEGEDSLEYELVDPAQYATELRHSAGLPERAEAAPHAGPWARTVDRLQERFDRARERPAVGEVLGFLQELRPAWWVVRGWAIVVGVAMTLEGGHWSRHVPVPGRSLLGLLALSAAVVASVKLGRQGSDRARPWRILDVAAGIAVAAIALHALTANPDATYVEVHQEAWQPPVLQHPDGEPITNLYLFDEDGNALQGVYVYDGVGRPVEIGDLGMAGFGHIDSVYPRDALGNPLTNRYPIQQYVVDEDESGRDRAPRPTPEVAPPVTTVDQDEREERPSPEDEAEVSPAEGPSPSGESTGRTEPE